MTWLDVARLLSSFSLAIALIAGGSFLAVQYVVAQFTAPPPRPTFPNDKPSPTAKPVVATPKQPFAIAPSPSSFASPSSNSSSSFISSPSSIASPSPSPTPSEKPREGGGYPARITQEIGLNVRENPDREASRIGGIDYNTRVTVLEESTDGQWQRVRVEDGGLEGWVKAGYTERLN